MALASLWFTQRNLFVNEQQINESCFTKWEHWDEPQVCSWKHQHLFSDWDYTSCLHTGYMSNVISSLRPFFWHGKGLEKTIWEAWQSVICWETRDQRCNPAKVQRQQMLVRMKKSKKKNLELHPWAALAPSAVNLNLTATWADTLEVVPSLHLHLPNLSRHNYRAAPASDASGSQASGCHKRRA